MDSGPTTGASEHVWRPAPVMASSIRLLAYALPIVAAYLVIRGVSGWLVRPGGLVGLTVWIVQAAAIGAVVSRMVGRVTRRLLPLASLYMMTLVFPDSAPARYRVAMRAGTVRQMRKRAAEFSRHGLGPTDAAAAENAVTLVVGLGRHDRLTRGHTERVRAYGDLIAAEMGITAAERNMLTWGALLHDIGKMTVSPHILNKVDRLTDDEWEVMRGHPAAGAEMLRPLAGWLGEWVHAAGQHHERWDGGGYPLGLAGDEISRAGRITAVADAYDVITSKRSYKKPMSAEAARRELVKCAGKQFDPVVVRALMSVSLPKLRSLGGLSSIPAIPHAATGGGFAASPVAASIGAGALVAATLMGLGDDTAARRAAVAAELSASEAVSQSSTPEATGGQAEARSLAPVERVGPAGTNAVSAAQGGGASDSAEPTGPTAAPSDPAAPAAPERDSHDQPEQNGPDDGPVDVDAPEVDPTGVDIPGVEIPGVTIPGVTIPGVKVPGVTVPGAGIPGMTVPGVELPAVELPGVTVPGVELPGVDLPGVTVPGVELPGVELPAVDLPGVTVPSIGTPLGTTPEITLPGAPIAPVVAPEIIVPSPTTPQIATPEPTTPEAGNPAVADPDDGEVGSAGGILGDLTGNDLGL